MGASGRGVKRENMTKPRNRVTLNLTGGYKGHGNKVQIAIGFDPDMLREIHHIQKHLRIKTTPETIRTLIAWGIGTVEDAGEME